MEERKRQIWEAERERREALIRKNNERLARLEAKRKNERSQIVFAFGSSTPRMLEPADTGGMSSSFWGTRRATSTSNVMTFSATAAPLTRRSSERELDVGSKKRATSAGGLDRKEGKCVDKLVIGFKYSKAHGGWIQVLYVLFLFDGCKVWRSARGRGVSNQVTAKGFIFPIHFFCFSEKKYHPLMSIYA